MADPHPGLRSPGGGLRLRLRYGRLGIWCVPALLMVLSVRAELVVQGPHLVRVVVRCRPDRLTKPELWRGGTNATARHTEASGGGVLTDASG